MQHHYCREVRMADQNERAFQKQPTINLNRKGGLKPSESRQRHHFLSVFHIGAKTL